MEQACPGFCFGSKSWALEPDGAIKMKRYRDKGSGKYPSGLPSMLNPFLLGRSCNVLHISAWPPFMEWCSDSSSESIPLPSTLQLLFQAPRQNYITSCHNTRRCSSLMPSTLSTCQHGSSSAVLKYVSQKPGSLKIALLHPTVVSSTTCFYQRNFICHFLINPI